MNRASVNLFPTFKPFPPRSVASREEGLSIHESLRQVFITHSCLFVSEPRSPSERRESDYFRQPLPAYLPLFLPERIFCLAAVSPPKFLFSPPPLIPERRSFGQRHFRFFLSFLFSPPLRCMTSASPLSFLPLPFCSRTLPLFLPRVLEFLPRVLTCEYPIGFFE